MQTANGEMYKDCTPQDFDHYFRGTAMVLKLPSDKKRLYVVEGIAGNGAITGSYLTREQVWKEKGINMRDWWTLLDVVLPHALHFNVGNAAGTWVPSLARNLKKSFPYATSYVKLYGNPTPEEASEQFVSSVAFGDFYSNQKLPDGEYALRSDRSATATEGHFVFDKHNRAVFFKHKVQIGKIATGSSLFRGRDFVELDHKHGVFKNLLINEAGLRPDQIIVLDPVKVSVPDPVEQKHQAEQQQQAQQPNNWQINAPQFGQWFENNGGGLAGNMMQQEFTAHAAQAQAQQNTWADIPVQFQWDWGTVMNYPAAAGPLPGASELVNPNMRPNIYLQLPIRASRWVRPGWGVGYATVDNNHLITIRVGAPPTALPIGHRPFCRWGQ